MTPDTPMPSMLARAKEFWHAKIVQSWTRVAKAGRGVEPDIKAKRKGGMERRPGTPPPQYTETSPQNHSEDASPRNASPSEAQQNNQIDSNPILNAPVQKDTPTVQDHSEDASPQNASLSEPQQNNRMDDYPILRAALVEENTGSHANRFLWDIVRILAVTFSADLQKPQTSTEHEQDKERKAVLAKKYTPNYDSLALVTKKREDALEELCNLVRHLEESLRCNRWPAVFQWEIVLATELVVHPAEWFDIPACYALEVLGRYRHGKGDGEPRNMVEYWTPSDWKNRPKDTPPMWDLADTLASHGALIGVLKLRKQQSAILEDAFNRFKKEKAMETLQNSRELQQETMLPRAAVQQYWNTRPLATRCLWPVSEGYLHLEDILRGTLVTSASPHTKQIERMKAARLNRSSDCSTGVGASQKQAVLRHGEVKLQ